MSQSALAGEPSPLCGVVLLDKPVGPTSFAMVRVVRRLSRVARVGHTGTLDPFASGLLTICIGRAATRLVPRLMAGEKEYVATLQLGVETETQDPEGQVVRQAPVPALTAADLEVCLVPLRGRRLQQPPRYSALKHQGKPLYYYARKGIDVTKPPREIEIRVMDNLGYDPVQQRLTLRVACSPGTYIRTLAEEIGRALGCGAHLVALRRLRSGGFLVDGALSAAELAGEDAAELLAGRLLSVEQILALLDGPMSAVHGPDFP
ncbi:MAG: tRNA pseudouridine(55) synthase TruB [Desulfobulbaceae bacterium A2]|nr:MAG: tRNA pseudouridine(55) synthase TruB [Desulfobulbaceae bacterium A2]